MRSYDVVMTPSDDGHWVLKSEADREIRHQKYKLCLAMSKWCKAQMVRYINSCDRYDSNYVNKKTGHYHKWLYKWMELAEKFKEA